MLGYKTHFGFKRSKKGPLKRGTTKALPGVLRCHRGRDAGRRQGPRHIYRNGTTGCARGCQAAELRTSAPHHEMLRQGLSAHLVCSTSPPLLLPPPGFVMGSVTYRHGPTWDWGQRQPGLATWKAAPCSPEIGGLKACCFLTHPHVKSVDLHPPAPSLGSIPLDEHPPSVILC